MNEFSEIMDLTCRKWTLAGKIEFLEHLPCDAVTVKVAEDFIELCDKTYAVSKIPEDFQFIFIFGKNSVDQDRTGCRT